MVKPLFLRNPQSLQWVLLLVVAVSPYFLTLPLDLLDIDTAQYGEIAREMVTGNNWIFLRDNGRNYLDKPILTFWTIALSFKLFGIGNVAFRIPALIATLLTAWSAGRIVQLRGGTREHGWLASILYLTLPGAFVLVFQPIIDVYLIAYLTLTHHAYYLGLKRHRAYYLLMYLFAGLGFITKGPIAVAIPLLSIGGDILIRRDWRRLLSMHIFPGLAITAVFPLAWSYALYQEFGSYGPFFFLWLQSFGRFYSRIYDSGINPAFFLTNFAWAAATVLVPVLAAAAASLRSWRGEGGIFRAVFARWRSDEFRQGDYAIVLWLWVYLALISFSRFQLPQYIYWVLPAAAMIGSDWLYDRWFKAAAKAGLATLAVPALAAVLAVLLPLATVDPDWRVVLPLVLILPAFALFQNRSHALTGLLVASTTLLFGVAAWVVFPQVVRFQPARQVAEILATQEPGKDHFYSFGLPLSKRSYMFYSGRMMRIPVNRQHFLDVVAREEPICLIPAEVMPLFQGYAAGQLELVPIAHFPTYKMATPTPQFLNKFTRKDSLKELGVYRVRLKQPKG